MSNAPEVRVRQFPLKSVFELALMKYADFHQRTLERQPDRHFQHRLAVNWIRHCGSNYDVLIRQHADQYPQIRAAVLTQIAELYPELGSECERQQHRHGTAPPASVEHRA